MEENKNNQNIENETFGGIEFHNEQIVNTPDSEKTKPPSKQTETIGGVEFKKQKEKEGEDVLNKKVKQEIDRANKQAQKHIEDESIHTMAEDMGEQAGAQQGAALQAVLKQERKSREEKKKRDVNFIYGLISVVLIVSAVGLFFYANRDDQTVTPATQVVRESLLIQKIIHE